VHCLQDDTDGHIELEEPRDLQTLSAYASGISLLTMLLRVKTGLACEHALRSAALDAGLQVCGVLMR